jgi:NADH-quinone oxidoreductase subunit L
VIELAILFAPAFAAAVAGLFQKPLGDRLCMALTTGLVLLAAGLSIYVFADLTWGGGQDRVIAIAPFVDVAGFTSNWSIRIDTLSAVMLVVVTSVSALVHVYSIGYMAQDPHRARFFSFLSLFTFAMLALVTANDFLQMFFGWEGVGLASYLLIGFWYHKPSANDAAIKAFVTNRVGDVGFALGIMACYLAYGTIAFDKLFAAIAANPHAGFHFEFLQAIGIHAALNAPALEVIGVLLFIGAMGKSAQLFLHVWLPDAMEGPTPVSALIHAATMVTAGVFMVCRVSPIYELAPFAAGMITITGAATALFAATVGLAQNDIKRVVAYSTCSQLGYMFFAAGVGAYGVAMFHLFTHAFFKALLFLGAGSVIHGLHHEQDMRQMGAVRRAMPLTWAAMLIGTLALIGFGLPGTSIGFAGFFSKDAAIEAAYAAGESGRFGGQFAFWASIAAAFLTSFYSWRLLFMTFEGKFRGAAHGNGHGHGHGHGQADGHDDHAAHAEAAHAPALAAGAAPAHESPLVMLLPLGVLAFGATFAGMAFAGLFVGAGAPGFWNGALALAHGEAAHGHHEVPVWVVWAPLVVTLVGFVLAFLIYGLRAGVGAWIAKATGPLNAFLVHKWYFDEIYHVVWVNGAKGLGDLLWKGGDKRLIDGLGPHGAVAAMRLGARNLRRAQTGYLYHYSFLMLLAVVAFGAFALWTTGRLGG